jgi:hypothetical protein
MERNFKKQIEHQSSHKMEEALDKDRVTHSKFVYKQLTP